jgi:hypothetical protein
MTIAEAGTVLVSAAAAYTITLPTAVGNTGLTYHFIKTDANYNLITLAANGAQTFNYENSTGAPVATYPRLNTYCAEVTVVSDGANWQCINERLGQVPECLVYLNGNQLNLVNGTWTEIILNAETYDIGNNFNTGTGYFTPPIPGKYQVIGNIAWLNAVANKIYGVQLNCVSPYLENCLYISIYSVSGEIDASAPLKILPAVAGTIIRMLGKSASGDNTVDVYGTYELTWMQVRLVAKD